MGDDMILCFDIGGSRIKAGLVPAGDSSGAVRPLGDAPTPTADFPGFLAALAGFARGHALRGVAISIAGVVEPETGEIRVANIPCADGKPLAAEIAATLGLPVVVLNDADCFVLAEARFGAGRGHSSVFGIILGTGVGGGLVIGGQLVQGAGGFAGEWGHGPVLAPGAHGLPPFACGCGMTGCLDAVGGARGIERLYRHVGGGDLPSTRILEAWAEGDAKASRVVALWGDILAGPLAMLLNVTGAGIVPVGGGLANVPALIAALDAKVRQGLLRQSDRPLLIPAQCQPEPGLIGAAVAAQARFGA
jgi:N-acetylglucosamine kinase